MISEIEETKYSKEHSTDGERCMCCSRLKSFDGEGHVVHGYWICSWNCTQRLKEQGFIDDNDIRERIL